MADLESRIAGVAAVLRSASNLFGPPGSARVVDLISAVVGLGEARDVQLNRIEQKIDDVRDLPWRRGQSLVREAMEMPDRRDAKLLQAAEKFEEAYDMYQREPTFSFWAALNAAAIFSALNDHMKARYHIANAYREGQKAVEIQCKSAPKIAVGGGLKVNVSWLGRKEGNQLDPDSLFVNKLFGKRWAQKLSEVGDFASGVEGIRFVAMQLGVQQDALPPPRQLLSSRRQNSPPVRYVSEEVPPDGWRDDAGRTDLGTVIVRVPSTIVWKAEGINRLGGAMGEKRYGLKKWFVMRDSDSRIAITTDQKHGQWLLASGTYRGVFVDTSFDDWRLTVIRRS